MEVKYLNNRSEKLILFFAGWGMDEKAFSHLSSSRYDVMIIFNYTRFPLNNCITSDCHFNGSNSNCPVYKSFTQYKEINIIAWSMGVWGATAAFDRFIGHLRPVSKFKTLRMMKKINKTIAINGTLCPISNIWGIPQKIFDGTILHLETDVRDKYTCRTSKNLMKFNLRMCGSKAVYEQYQSSAPERGLEDILNELKAIRDNYCFSNSIFWNTIIISGKDPIFPTENQNQFWADYELGIDKTDKFSFNSHNFMIRHIDAPHYPFFLWKTWDEIINIECMN